MPRTKFTKEAIASVEGLRAVWSSIDGCIARGNPAGAVFQLVAVSLSAPQLGLGGGLAAREWAASGGGICMTAAVFPSTMFDKWHAVLKRVAWQLPYNSENWQTVLEVLRDAEQQLAAAGLDCGSSAKLVQQLVAAYLSAGGPSQQQPSLGAALPLPQQQAVPGAAQPASLPQPREQQQSGRSKRRAALAAQAAFAAGGGDDDDSGLLLHDQENALNVLQSPQSRKVFAVAAPRLDAKQALQPLGQPPSSTKRHRR